jgi:hypothetical protein
MTLSPVEAARYARQILLAEVGVEGQARICAAEARVGGEGLVHELAESYAERAGFAAVLPGPVDVEALAPRRLIREPAARAVLAGARAALAAMRKALGGGDPSATDPP